MTNDLVDGDVRALENGYNALMEEFTNYQVETNRTLSLLENKLDINTKEYNRQIIKLTESLPTIIRKVVGHIEFARPLDKK